MCREYKKTRVIKLDEQTKQLTCSVCKKPVGDVNSHAMQTGHAEFGYMNTATWGV